MGYNYDDEDDNSCYTECFSQCVENHNHEFLSTTDNQRDDEGVIHNHRIAGITGHPIKHRKNHIHKINVLTDTFDDHFHEICDTTGPAIYLPDGKHIHLIKGTTTCEDGHKHDYYFTTLVQDPTNVPQKRRC